MRAMRTIAAVLVIAALFACKKKKDENALPDAAADAPIVELDVAPPPTAEFDAGAVVIDAAPAPRVVTPVKKDAGTVTGQAGAPATDAGGSNVLGLAGAMAGLQCTGNCVKKFGECIATSKDQAANRKCRDDMLACRKTCPGG